MNLKLTHAFGALALGSLAALGMAAPAGAAYPDRPVTLVVPFPPGGAVDTLGRLFADSINSQTGQPVVVENRAGANGNIGTEAVVKAAPDGYTLLIGANGMATNPTIYPNRSFNEVKDLKTVAYVGYAPLILVTAYDSPYKSFEDLLKAAQAKPDAVSFATSGSGSAPHLASELLKLTTKSEMLHVPYKGGSPAKLDLVTGRVSFMFLNPLEAVPQVNAKKLRALMIDSPGRITQLPDVPTSKELGYSDLEAKVWWGFMVPAGTPDDIVTKVNGYINTALQDPKVQDKLKQMAVVIGGGSVAEFDKYYHEQVEKWARVVKEAGLSTQ
ncbi:tripartite tricarboxylate transporter substrate binding protein [Pusillimonas sp. MFBS29]|uniref:Bug family tripartite tricarboxylate transporter substrate binding protein n=1 Tax=Pusillimonas sp. MFBS29 TaxID=2886690 RepID=UPI001D0FCCCE|nr:tripartite tricarboxylate transporter substrate binding protein [Pusillimonas sp. MFBS29]MCC2595354.1 tripartite tricarboxylate transporter substrate binding protein [Pusillimonas sp. MFBS29]